MKDYIVLVPETSEPGEPLSQETCAIIRALAPLGWVVMTFGFQREIAMGGDTGGEAPTYVELVFEHIDSIKERCAVFSTPAKYAEDFIAKNGV